ncbi:sulfurtransferase [Corynebacterium kroppenstedtii]|uniref:sulfurtransferase n=1 Tax=Corynebacterium sp. PCR 32 TaxID=3351342 RepID=UPI0030A51DB2
MAAPLDPHPLLQDYAHPDKVVTSQWLGAKLGSPDVRVVESDEDSLLYDLGHIPTAMRIDWRRDLSDPLTRDVIDAEGFARLMRSKGIRRDDTVIIYGDHSNWWAAFTFWVFTLYGHPDVRLLNGGRDAWIRAERETSFVVPENPESDYPVPDLALSERISVQDVCRDYESSQLIDVRTPEEYRGESMDSGPSPSAKGTLRTGHIPGAVNIPWDSAVYPNSDFRSADELREIFGALDSSDPTVTYCLTGERSAHTWFVLRYLLGWEDVKNYYGSWAEWGNMVGMPISRAE